MISRLFCNFLERNAQCENARKLQKRTKKRTTALKKLRRLLLHDILKISVNLKQYSRGLPAMKKKLFCIFGLILIVSAIAYFCHDHSVLPLDAENANYISFKIYPQNEPNYMVTNDDRVKEIVRAINELDAQETTDQVDKMSDSFYYFWIQISDKDIPVELDEDTISINNERYQADTSDLRELLDKTYRDVMSGIID